MDQEKEDTIRPDGRQDKKRRKKNMAETERAKKQDHHF